MAEELTRPYWPVDGCPLTLTYNPEGGGLMMLVERGIPCESHTQVFSAHCTNGPDAEDVAVELREYGPYYKKVWDAFVGLMHAMQSPDVCKRDTDWSTKEALGAVVCAWLVRQVARGSEQRWEERHR